MILSFRSLPTQWRTIMIGLLLLVLAVFLLLLIYEISGGKKQKMMVPDGILFAGLFLFTVVLLHENGSGRTGTALIIPAFPVLIVTVLGISYAAVRFICVFRSKDEKSTRNMIQEGLNNLPSGIGFFDQNGLPRLINRQMCRVCEVLSGRDIQSMDEMEQALRFPAPEVRVLDSENMIYAFPSEKIWKFSRTWITTDRGEKFIQFLASDISELYHTKQMLESENERLRAMSESLKELSKNILAVTREEETLAMKMRVHDELGHDILVTQQMMMKETNESEVAEIMDQWRRTLKLIRGDQETFSDAEWISGMEQRAEMLGIRIRYQGNFPENADIERLIRAAVQECMTNSVRHGKATELLVKMSETGNDYMAEISDNGNFPEQDIVEGGGLSGLRRQVENSGGSMEIRISPVFSVRLTIPKK